MSLRAYERRLARLEAKLPPVVTAAEREQEERKRAELERLLKTGTRVQALAAFEQLRPRGFIHNAERECKLPPSLDPRAAFEAFRNSCSIQPPDCESGARVGEGIALK